MAAPYELMNATSPARDAEQSGATPTGFGAPASGGYGAPSAGGPPSGGYGAPSNDGGGAPSVGGAGAGGALAELIQDYRQTFLLAAEDLRRRTENIEPQAELQKLQNQVKPTIDQYKANVTDLSPRQIPDAMYRYYSWAGVCMLGGAITALIGANIPILSLVGLTALPSILIACVAVPLFVANYGNGDKLATFYGALVIGLLAGHASNSAYFVHLTPPAVLLPIGIALTLALAGDKLASDRRVLIGACVGAPSLVALVLGLVLGSLDFTYLLFTVGYAAAFGVSLQLALADATVGEKDALNLVAAITAVAFVLTMLLGKSRDAYDAAVAAQANRNEL